MRYESEPWDETEDCELAPLSLLGIKRVSFCSFEAYSVETYVLVS